MSSHRSGISRIEVAVIILAISVVGSLTVRSLISARENARRVECKNTLKQLGIALSNYHDFHESFPCGTVGQHNLPPEKRWSWYPSLWHLLAPPGYHPEIPLDKPWDTPEIHPLKVEYVEVRGDGSSVYIDLPGLFHVFCPNSLPTELVYGMRPATYVGISGVGEDAAALESKHKRAGIWGYDRCTSNDEISDGRSRTIMVIETARENGCWLSGGLATVLGVDPTKNPAIGKSGQFGGFHEGVCNVLFADGRVDEFDESINLKVLSALATKAGNED